MSLEGERMVSDSVSESEPLESLLGSSLVDELVEGDEARLASALERVVGVMASKDSLLNLEAGADMSVP